MKHTYLRATLSCLLLIIGWLVNTGAIAQGTAERKVSGRVLDGADNNALPGVNVVVKGTQTGVTSDAGGRFTINLPTSEHAGRVRHWVCYSGS